MKSGSERSAELEFVCRDGDPVTYWQMVVESRLSALQRPADDREKVRIIKSLVRLRAGFVNGVDPELRDLHGIRQPEYSESVLQDCDRRFHEVVGVSHVV